MSAGKAKKKPTTQYVTTGKNAAITITVGIVFLTLGLCWLLSMMTAAEGYITKQLAASLNGLCGSFCVPFPLLMIWCGVNMLVSARHRVNARGTAIVLLMYVLVLTFFTLTARYSADFSYLDFVKKQYAQASYGAFLQKAYMDGAKGAGGLIGMLFAYPMWQVAGTVLSVIFVVALFITLIFVLLRKNPGDLIRQFSETNEVRMARRQQRQQEKEAARAEKEAQRQQEMMLQAQQAEAVQQMPMEPVVQGQYVERQEDVYEYPADPVPVYQPAAPVRQTVRNVDGFYPVSNELYDEKFPLHNGSTSGMGYEPPVQQPVYQQKQQKPAPVKQGTFGVPAEEKKQEEKKPFFRIPKKETPVPAEDKILEEKPASVWKKQEAEKEVPVQPVMPLYAEEDDDILPWDETVVPVKEAPAKQERTGTRPVQQEMFPEEEEEKPYVPPVRPAVKVQSAPEEKRQEKPKSSWSDMVQKRQQELHNGEMPAHTTTKGEPKPVYTDPVMPISSERIPIKPVPQPKDDAKLDGTRAPQMKQTEMTMAIRYQAPPIRLLKESKVVSSEDSAQEDNQRAEIIEGTLGSFGVDAEVKQIMHGPSITRFAIQIAPGVKVSKVTNTADNLALDLKTKHVRVEAPIQGTSYIGIEVPNKLVSTVSLKEVLDSEKMRNATSPLMVALGMDIAGSPVLCDLSKMPHLLIAGATGSGKSVCINSIVCSLLYRSSPEQVRLIMIDPKQVELTVYNSIPHLLVPVISDPRKAAGALAWVVQEMQERYGKFSSEGVRNLAGYNDMYRGTDKELPNIVVIIDEMADLMEVCRKDVEESIRRLAALARAAGIYMVLATQRPSVDVITGVVKNNIPSRIAFAVSSGTDSRTIIDIYGAEKLMGKGDMLYKPAGSSPVRVQGCFVSDDEVNAITDYISRRYETSYDPNIMEHLENADKETPTADTIGGEDRPHSAGGDNGDGTDELLMEAIEMAVEDEQISTSLLQRRFRIGYARAGRLVDEMEKRGIVSASEGSKPRKCLITREQYYQMFEEQ